MVDQPALYFEKRFGALHPVNTAAVEAVKATTGRCRAELKGMRANEARRGFYWIMLDVAAVALTDMTGQPWDQQLLHDELKRRLKLGIFFTTPSGAEVFKPRSTSNRAMTEVERAQWTDRCANVLSVWLQVPITDLMDEVRRQTGVAA